MTPRATQAAVALTLAALLIVAALCVVGCAVSAPGLSVRRVARKSHRCGSCDGRVISPGDVYLVHTSFPGHDSGYADAAGHPVRMAECAWCAARYQRDYLLEPIPAAFEARYSEGLANKGLL